MQVNDRLDAGAAAEIVRRRLASQRLTSHAAMAPADVVAWLGAVQACKTTSGALWAVGLRSGGVDEGDVERAIADRAIVRSWPMRGTLHFLAAADARWMIELLAPRAVRSAASRLGAMDIDDAVLSRARRALVAELEGGRRLTRPAAHRVLARARIPTGGQRGLMILWRLAHDGLVCFGPREGKQHTFVLLDEWLAPAKPLRGDEALGELARRYFAGHGPATLRDLALAWWSGSGLTDAQRAVEIAGRSLEQEDIGGHMVWSARDRPRGASRRGGGAAYALPAFDELFVGYADRAAPIDPEHAARLTPFDVLGPVLVVGGKLVARWKRRLMRGKVACTMTPVAPLTARRIAAARHALERYARFLGLDLEEA